MMNKTIKIIGIVATIISMGSTLVHDWVDDKKIDAKIAKKVNEVLTKRDEWES